MSYFIRVGGILTEIHKWLDEVSFNSFSEEISSRVIGQYDLITIIAMVYNYLHNVVYDLPINHNIILAAPSGSGKTETYRALKEYFGKHIPSLPVYIRDMTSITGTGYKGNNPDSILLPLANNSLEYPVGLVFLDEFDKIIMPERTSTGENPNLLVQYHILTMIEGATMSCEVERGIKKDINTHKLMYIGMGSFDYFREEKKKDASSIGFGLSSNVIEHYEPITREEIIKAGGCYELIGRFTLIVNYDELTTKAINGIIDKYIDELQKTYNCELVVRKNYREMLHNIANGDFGCRLIRNTLADSLIELYAKALNEVSDITQKKLVIKLSANNSAYSWRALTDQERKSSEELESAKYMELYEGIVDDSLPNV